MCAVVEPGDAGNVFWDTLRHRPDKRSATSRTARRVPGRRHRHRLSCSRSRAKVRVPSPAPLFEFGLGLRDGFDRTFTALLATRCSLPVAS
jgi:hypothetical protein